MVRSVVSPLKSCRGKTLIKVRDHYIIKCNRPLKFTALCLVRDAAARLPEGVGTRADICVLVRDSQFVFEDSSDSQINKVVGGALDRLHYENDPCVKYEKRWHQWAYSSKRKLYVFKFYTQIFTPRSTYDLVNLQI
ncbi:hypothetical protein HAX54_020937 [Datura stramonium]|uniref:Nuclear factor related to kappa-B-binding protein second winged helix domain-containing protein n=1 Tax=Datura stramonium TaxID=4076 RepID=A0ABS8UTY7_DATST|nr:hypothetical protein [Datura stramonium]